MENSDKIKSQLQFDIKSELNDIQYAAATAIHGPTLIIAGAGSGKTRTLTYRIAYMISQEILPQEILALTFTNKAATEMRERIRNVVGEKNTRHLQMGTFHSIFSRILRNESETTGFIPNFTIYDQADSKSLIRAVIKELNFDEEKYKPNNVLARISHAKNMLITSQSYAQNNKILDEDSQRGNPYIANIYALYEEKCKLANAMDFDDLLLQTNILFRNHPEILTKYQNKFKYILVDEYQDTNYSQYLIVKKLAQGYGNICVVGDDAQSIYAFRGARIENILNFKKDYPNYKEFKLEQNYRSTKNIVNAANSVIKNNSKQLKKYCFSHGETGEKIGVIKAYTDNEEGILIANSIEENMCRTKANYSDFAVLYRTNVQARIFEDALRKKNMPYKIYGGLSFYQRAEIKDFIAYLRLCVNHSDDEAFKRIINYPKRGIGDLTIERLTELANINKKNMLNAIKECDLSNTDISLATQKKLHDFANYISSMTIKAYAADAFDFAKEIAITSGLLAELNHDTTHEGKTRVENIESLLNAVKDFTDRERDRESEEQKTDFVVTINHFLDNVALLTDADNEKDEDKNKISLMTIHQAKGLEYDYVYITGLEENLFPGNVQNISIDDMEEERRLFYVALTRAKIKATISYSQTRYRWGKLNNQNASRFAFEIDEKYLEKSIKETANAPKFIDDDFDEKIKMVLSGQPLSTTKKTTIVRRPQPIQHTPSGNFKPSNNKDVKIGMRIKHERFGLGKVVDVQGSGDSGLMTIMFDDCGKKTLMFKFSKIMIL